MLAYITVTVAGESQEEDPGEAQSTSATDPVSVGFTLGLRTAVHTDGSAAIRKLQEDCSPTVVVECSETRVKEKERFVGLHFNPSSGRMLRSHRPGPMRLCDWRRWENGRVFAYGGNQVKLSVWDTEKALSQQGGTDAASPPPPTEGKKRKRTPELLHG
ncbi:hypothetical protein OH76DRAFT_656258 [Lentinus brumalis]|uniref:Uncharacterized protein n=1 Tax=Lentinus brumalis TaxID=2498619 RepID=A0A371D7I1_9APHY|nr:hypothetical protein OH76DRAFT_656258 [Polyporus brumalis]